MTEHLTPAQLAERWQRRREWVTQQARAGAIPGAVRIGHFWRFPLDAIERFEQRHATADPLRMTDLSEKRQKAS